MFGNPCFGPVVISAVGENELDFVSGSEVEEVLETVLIGLAAAGAFEVHDFDDTRIHAGHVLGPAGFKQDGESKVAKAGEQGENIGLEERLATGDLDHGTIEDADFGDDLVEAHGDPLGERVSGVAPGAAQPTSRKPHKHARQPGVSGLALNAIENLVDDESFGHAANPNKR